MMRLSKFLISVCTLFPAVVLCDEAQEEFLRRDPALVARTGSQWEAQVHLVNESAQTYQTPFNPLLDGRSLLESWMGKRQETCVNSGYSPCSDGNGCCPTNGYGCCPLGCCPTGKTCCTTSNTCADPGDVCCDGGYLCPSGWNCCTQGTCYPNGGQCCSTGYYCTPGNICVLVDGAQKCCTDNQCTAHVSGTVTISAPSLPTNTDQTLTNAPPATTAAPSQNTLVVQYTYYTYTITWYYISWYWTILFQQSESTYATITNYYTTSVYASNTYAAYSSLLDISKTLTFNTPAAASTLSPLPESTTASSPAAASSTSPDTDTDFSVSINTSAFDSVFGETSTPAVTEPSINTSLHAGSEPSSTTSSSSKSSPATQTGNNAAGSLKHGWGGSWAFGGFVGLWIGVGGLMIWL